MTTLIAFTAHQPNGLSAAYLASDSRISWFENGNHRWDAGRKLFASTLFPDVFGYAGDVVFPALALSQIVSAIDAGLVFCDEDDTWTRHHKVVSLLQESFSQRHHADDQDFYVLHLSRQGSDPDATVHVWSTEYSVLNSRWHDRVLDVPRRTAVIERLGTGRAEAAAHQRSWQGKSSAFTREIFGSFCAAIAAGGDPKSGGSPQLAGFYDKGSARSFGVLHKGVASFHGLPLTQPIHSAEVEWRDELFQRIDIDTRRLVEGAQVHGGKVR